MTHNEHCECREPKLAAKNTDDKLRCAACRKLLTLSQAVALARSAPAGVTTALGFNFYDLR